VNASDVEMLRTHSRRGRRSAEEGRDLAQEEMGKLAGGMNLPFKLPF
jgi:hypothetical protein